MLTPARIWRRLWNVVTRSTRDRELDEELEFHIAMETRRLEAQGVSSAEAAAQARRTFGPITEHRESAHDARRTRPFEDFLHDCRFAFRALRQQRVFAVVAVLTLALGIGGTTAIFGAVYNVLLAPYPYADADRIVTLWEATTDGNGERNGVSPGTFLAWQERARSFEYLAAIEPYSLDYIGPDGPVQFQTSVVTEHFFDVFRARPMLGRVFTADDFAASGNRVAVLSELLWRARFGGDSSIVGRVVILDSLPTTIVGIVSLDVDLKSGEQIWIPKHFRPDERTDYRSAYYTVGGKLREGVTVDAAAREMATLAHGIAVERDGPRSKATAATLRLDDTLMTDARQPLYLLLGAVLCVLLIACANVANLQLAQAVRRHRELSIRAALGAGRGRLMRQLLAESTVLALLGGVTGLVVSAAGVRAIRALAPADLPRVDHIAISAPILAFALLLSMGTALFFGLIPMVYAGRSEAGDAIVAAGGRGTTGTRGRRRVQRTLVAMETAFAVVLLVGAGLLIRSFSTLLDVDRGYDTSGVTNVTLQTWSYYRTPQARAAFVDEAIERLRAIPGVENAAMTSSLPLSVPIGMEQTSVAVEGQPAADPTEQPNIRVAAASSAYFATMRTPLRAGRPFERTDNAASTPVAIVNDAFVRRYFSGQNAIGRRISFGFMTRPIERTIVGVVGDMRHEGLASDPVPTAFIPHAQGSTGATQLVVRSALPTSEIQRAVRRELVAMNGVMPLTAMTTLEDRLADSLRERRFQLAMLAAFSAVALVLAVIGIYGVMSHITSERTREIGVRIAVGAVASDVIGMIVRQGVAITTAGVAAGLVAAAMLTRLMTGMLYGVSAIDPLTYVTAIAALVIASVIAVWLPARRASRIDPVLTLREE